MARKNRTGALPGASLAVRHPGSRRRVTVQVIPVLGTARALWQVPPAAIVLVTDPRQFRPAAVDAIKATFGLSDAEARLATALQSGGSLQDCADGLGISVNTAKTQLKSLYAKTGFRNHVDLANALANIALVAPRDP